MGVSSVHEKIKPYKCTQCKYAATLKSTLASHIKTVHEKIKPFACNHCGYVTSKRGNLNQHVRNIHPKEEIPFPKTTKTDAKTPLKDDVVMVQVDISSELGLEARVVG